MSHLKPLIAPVSRLTAPSVALARPEIPRIASLPYQTIRCAVTKTEKTKKKNNVRKTYIQYDLKLAEQFALVDAMQYIRAFEVGQSPQSVKYELAVRLRSLKNGPVIRNRLRLPHPVKTDIRICVIAEPNSKAAAEARAAGAILVGEDDIFNQVKEGNINFERMICHTDSLQKLSKAGLGRILGPKGLMPSAKAGTVVPRVGAAVQDMTGGSEYREKLGVLRLAIGQLGFTPEQLQSNIKKFMEQLTTDMARLGEKTSKEVHEVVLSSTHAPGFTLNGEYRGVESIPPNQLSGPL